MKLLHLTYNKYWLNYLHNEKFLMVLTLIISKSVIIRCLIQACVYISCQRISFEKNPLFLFTYKHQCTSHFLLQAQNHCMNLILTFWLSFCINLRNSCSLRDGNKFMSNTIDFVQTYDENFWFQILHFQFIYKVKMMIIVCC